MMTEYRPIEGHPMYLACSDGYVINAKTGLVLKGEVHKKTGYVKVQLSDESHKQKHYLLHRIIASAFCEKEPQKIEVNHIDGNKLNNRAENLEWVTRDENLRHAYENGLMPNCTVSRKVIAINIETGERAEFSSIYTASKLTGISKGNICMACKGDRPYAGGFYWQYKQEDE